MADERTVRRPSLLLMFFATVGILSLLVVFAIFGLVGLVVNSIGSFSSSRMGDKPDSYTSVITSDAIAGIRLEGEINSTMAEPVLEKIMDAEKDSRVKGILFEVNSPGGAVVPSQEIYDAILKVKAKKPVVAYVREMAASGAYYSSASATKIIANRGSLVGSIGVILSTLETSQLLTWLKLRPVTLKTGKLKDSGSPTREWTEDDKNYLQKLINDTRDQFVKDIRAGRTLPDSTVTHMSDGRVVLATEGLELKLIDGIGSRDDVLKEISTLAGLKDTPKLVYLEDKETFEDAITNLLRPKNQMQELEKKLELLFEQGSRGINFERK